MLAKVDTQFMQEETGKPYMGCEALPTRVTLPTVRNRLQTAPARIVP